MPRVKDRKGKPIEQSRITHDQYDRMRQIYYQTNSVGRAAKAAGVSEETAREYVSRPYPKFGGDLSIADWAVKARQENSAEAIEIAKHTRTTMVSTVAMSVGQALREVSKGRLKLRGEVQPDGTISIDVDEMSKALRVVGIGDAILKSGEAAILGKPDPGAGGSAAAQANVHLHIGPQQVFQGQRDLGQPFGPIPVNGQTSFERTMSLQSRNAKTLARLGTDDHDRVLAAVRSGHESRVQMERDRQSEREEV